MDRWRSLVRGARGRSTAVALALLIGANLVPLVGVLFLGWDVASILTTYWLENGVIGLLNIVRIMLARAPDNNAGSRHSRVGLAAFFTLHYGVFWLAHGVLIGVVAGDYGPPAQDILAPIGLITAQPALLVGALALLASHTASLVSNFIGRGEYLRVSPGAQLFWPYPRVFLLHIVVLVGAGAVIARGQPALLVALLVIGKTVLDLAFHLAERARYRRQAPATA